MSQVNRPIDAQSTQPLQDFWLTVKRFALSLGKDFIAHGCQKSAAALTYMTLFALVPLMTVIYSVFSMIPAFDGVAEQLQHMAFSHFVPKTGNEIQKYLTEFSQQARSLTGVGVGMLVVTAYLMLTNIEKTFNHIWGVVRARKGLSSFLLYWAVLSIGPILLGVGLAINTYLLSLELLLDNYYLLGVPTLVFHALPLLLTAMAFTLLFGAVPNCRVPLRYALIGGAITAVLFEILKAVFSAFVASSSMTVVYGAFAVVPLFLLWVNLVWTVVLAGAILVRTLAERPYLAAEVKTTDTVAALKCLRLFYERRSLGEGVSDHDCYASGLGVVSWQQLRTRLERGKWITPTSGGRYILTRDLDKLTLWDLALILDFKLSELDASLGNADRFPWLTEYVNRRNQVAAAVKQSFSLPLDELLTEDSNKVQEEKTVKVDASALKTQ
jgi:membrane protein